jgi:DNA-binding IclR family transcriptional regulator
MRSQLQILLAFDKGVGSLTAADVVASTELPRSTVFRSLRTLAKSGFLIQTASGGSSRYRLGPRILQLGLAARAQLTEDDLIVGPCLDLARDTGETVTFGVVDVPWRVCTYVAEAPSDLRHVAYIGARYPLYLGAASKVLLANLAPSVIDAVLRGSDLSKAAQAGLRQQLETIRTAGYAITTAERVSETTAVAAPVFLSGHLLGSVAVSGPEERLSRTIEPARDAVVRVAHHIADRLGSSGAGLALDRGPSSGRGGDHVEPSSSRAAGTAVKTARPRAAGRSVSADDS